MAAVLSKRQMTEEDIKLQFITPAITKKWALSLITMETSRLYSLFERKHSNCNR